MTAFQALGLKPRAPVNLLDFADPEKRRFWADTKSMRVFSLYDPALPMREVDLFVQEPIPHLIALKRVAGRPQDLLDIEALEEIQRRRKETDRG